MSAPAALVQLLEPWSELYSNSTPLSTFVVFGHLAALLLGGGLAVAMDRVTLKVWDGAPDVRVRHLDALASAHRLVVAGLATSFVTGVLLFAADVETYFVSPILWTKLVLVALLLANGYWMTRMESRIAKEATGTDRLWRVLRRAAGVSITLWFAITFVGVALVNA